MVDKNIRMREAKSQYSCKRWLVEDLASEFSCRRLPEDERCRPDSSSPPASLCQAFVEPTQPNSKGYTQVMERSLSRSVSPRALRPRSAAPSGKFNRSPLRLSDSNKHGSVANSEPSAFWKEIFDRRSADRAQSPSSELDRKMDSLQRAFDSLDFSTPRTPRTPRRERHATTEVSDDKFPHGPEHFFYDKRTYTGTHRHGGPRVID